MSVSVSGDSPHQVDDDKYDDHCQYDDRCYDCAGNGPSIPTRTGCSKRD